MGHFIPYVQNGIFITSIKKLSPFQIVSINKKSKWCYFGFTSCVCVLYFMQTVIFEHITQHTPIHMSMGNLKIIMSWA